MRRSRHSTCLRRFGSTPCLCVPSLWGAGQRIFRKLSPREQQQFFVDCTRFFAERYGEDNIISAVVHMDETTPHLHLNLIPIADGRLSAKTLFGRKELQSLQTDIHSAVGKKWGLQRGRKAERSTSPRRSSRRRRSSSRRTEKPIANCG